MRILLLGVNALGDSGGGYTFSQDVYQALLRVSEKYSHRFFLFDSTSKNGSNRELPRHISTIPAERSFLRRLAERFAYEAKRRMPSASGGIRWEAPYIPAFKREVIQNRLDCAFSLLPWTWSPILPNIVTVWDLEHRRKPYFPELTDQDWGWGWEERERNYQAVLPRAAAVITGTEFGKSQIEHFYGVDPAVIRVIPFPTPSFALDHANPLKRGSFKLPAGVFGEFLFYPAQYWPHKNHFRLLQTVKILRERHGWKGCLVCCGSDKGNLKYTRERAAELGVGDQVRFLGFVTQEELIALYREALALVFVSYLGPDNLPPLEAFALGCPVIASAIDGAEEALGRAAVYADPDNATDIAAAVCRIKEEEGLREKLIAEGRMRASHSTVGNYVDELFHLLDTLETRFECFRR